MTEIFHQLCSRLTSRYGAGEARALAFYVLEEVLGVSRTDIYAGKDNHISVDVRRRLDNICMRLEGGEPVQYVLGTAWFMGRRFAVTPAVLIPRPETEELVARAIALWRGGAVLDAGTGSGCIAVSMALALPDARVTAWDVSRDALSVARRNGEALGATVTWQEADILAEPEREAHTYSLVVSNPPYIPTCERSTMATHVTEHEPSLALFVPDDDPLRYYRALGRRACHGLVAPGGHLVVECHRDGVLSVVKLFEGMGLRRVVPHRDEMGNWRIVEAEMP